MPSANDNPCLACSIGQDCCTRLDGLKLTAEEFHGLFERHAGVLNVRRRGPVYEVAGRGKACPNWQSGGCSVYESRPVECRLFPWTTGSVTRRGRFVLVTYHHRTRCPLKRRLLAPRAKAAEMAISFAKGAFGREAGLIVVLPEILPARLLKRLLAFA